MARKSLGAKIQGLAVLCVLAFFCGLGQRFGNQGSVPSARTDSRGTEPYYSTCTIGRFSRVLAEIAAEEKRFPAVPTDISESCEQITSAFRAGDKVRDPEKENLFDSRYKFKRVRWRARVVGVATGNWTVEAARETFGTQHGVVLQFQCNPANFTEERVYSDGVVFFDGDKIDQAALEQFRKGSFIEFEGVLTDYSTRLRLGSEWTCLYLKGLSFR